MRCVTWWCECANAIVRATNRPKSQAYFHRGDHVQRAAAHREIQQGLIDIKQALMYFVDIPDLSKHLEEPPELPDGDEFLDPDVEPAFCFLVSVKRCLLSLS